MLDGVAGFVAFLVAQDVVVAMRQEFRMDHTISSAVLVGFVRLRRRSRQGLLMRMTQRVNVLNDPARCWRGLQCFSSRFPPGPFWSQGVSGVIWATSWTRWCWAYSFTPTEDKAEDDA